MVKLNDQMNSIYEQFPTGRDDFLGTRPDLKQALQQAHADLPDLNRQLHAAPDTTPMPFDQWKKLADAKAAAQAKIDEGDKAYAQWVEGQRAKLFAATAGTSSRMSELRAEARELITTGLQLRVRLGLDLKAPSLAAATLDLLPMPGYGLPVE